MPFNADTGIKVKMILPCLCLRGGQTPLLIGMVDGAIQGVAYNPYMCLVMRYSRFMCAVLSMFTFPLTHCLRCQNGIVKQSQFLVKTA